MVADRQRKLARSIALTTLISWPSSPEHRQSATMAASISLASALVGAEIVSV